MDYNENGVLCTKHRLWKKRQLVKDIVDAMEERGYTFKELVYGEPNNFVFADYVEEIDDILRKKGGFYGIRIKFERPGVLLEINSNSDGIDNVHYDVFADNQGRIEQVLEDLDDITLMIKPSSDTVEKISEAIAKNPKVRNGVLLLLVGVILYFLGVHVFLFDIIGFLFSFSPFLVIYLIYIFWRRR